jgi:hypothetical protein
MLEKEKVLSSINVTSDNTIYVNSIISITEDGSELSSSQYVDILSIGDDLTDQDPKVVAIANATWTPEVVSAYEESEAEMAAMEATV